MVLAPADEAAAWCEAAARPRLSVAPMMAWTTPHFRTLLRLLTQRTLLYTEMVPVDALLAAAERSPGHLRALLGVEPSHRPLAIQLGGRDPAAMADAARHCCAALEGVDEININVGCPSDTVSGHHCYGAALMKEPARVQRLAAAVRRAVPPTTAVTVKHRLGVDDCDSWEQLVEFVRIVSAAPASVRHFVVHARKAILGLSTAGNREVPPLRHDWVLRLAREFPHLSFDLNGGVANLDQAAALLATAGPALQGVMIGRAAFHAPWMLAVADGDRRIFSDGDDGGAGAAGDPAASTKPLTRRQVVGRYLEYAEGAWEEGRRRLEADVRRELGAVGARAPSAHAVAHRLKPRLTTLREALYLPLMNLFAAPQRHGATTEAPAPTGSQSEDMPECSAEDVAEAAAVEWRKRLEKTLAKRAALGKAAAYALRAVESIADLPPPGLT